ncbi:unnamed protein product [Ectocarpus sp. CCAP 1310/34]|nr:unnamed protein product [Ectocarpus sp. CCAP 1310/34]
MTIIVEVFGEFGLTVSEKKTETLLMRAKDKPTATSQPAPPPPLTIEAAGQKYAQTTEFRDLGGLANEHSDLTREISYRSRGAWACLRRCGRELFDRPQAPFRLKIRLLQAEAMEALLYGCMTWSPLNGHYQTLRSIHHRLLLRVIGYKRKKDTYRQLSYAQAPKRVECQSVEATIRQRRLLLARALARQPDGRLPKRLMLGELAGGEKRRRGGQKQNWPKCVLDDLKAFGADHGSTKTDPCCLGIPVPKDTAPKLKWTEAAKVEGGVPWHAAVLQGAERFMTSWHEKRPADNGRSNETTSHQPMGREGRKRRTRRRGKRANEKRLTE